jgi:RNA polymerase sigma-54 factor
MIQSMEILQLPIQALEARIDSELSENPLLERIEEDFPAPDSSADRENPDAPTATGEKELVVDDKSGKDDFERLLDLHREIPDHFDGPKPSSNRVQQASDRQHDQIANLAARPVTLRDALDLQLHELDLPTNLLRMCERVVSSLDSNGYLQSSLPDLLPPTADEIELKLAEEALKIVQGLEPAGVGARDLRECLLLQLPLDDPLYEEMHILISNHLEDLKENRMPLIQKKTGWSIDDIREIWDEVKRLNPKPGASFQNVHVQTVIPDVFLDVNEDGSYRVWMEEGRTPQLRISNYYRERLMSSDATPEEKEYIKRKVNAAGWLIDSIAQRRDTLTRVAQAIVDHQNKFIEDGPESIEPLKMQQIADKVGVHVTTVSRAVDDKWIQTPRGVFALRRFFVGGTTSADGEEIAWDAIRNKLQEVIDAEDKSKPFSDDQLVDQLSKHGLKVARRTVTKYRKKMDIPSSRQRRDWSKAK